MGKTEKTIIILLTVAVVLQFLISYLNFGNVVVLAIYEFYLCCIIICLPIIFKKKEIRIPGIIIITWIIFILLFIRNSFMLLISISLTSGNFHLD